MPTLLRSFHSGLLGCQRAASCSSTSNIVYRFPKKNTKDALLAMHQKYLVDDEHYKGLKAAPTEAAAWLDYTIRDMLRYPYSMVAYDGSRPIGFSMVSVRYREEAKNHSKKLGPKPPLSNYSYILRMVDFAEKQMWQANPDYRMIGIARTIYVEPEYRRRGIGAILLETQYEELKKMSKGDDMDAIISVSTGTANHKQLEKIEFVPAGIEIPDELYRKEDGEVFHSMDEKMPRAVVMIMRF